MIVSGTCKASDAAVCYMCNGTTCCTLSSQAGQAEKGMCAHSPVIVCPALTVCLLHFLKPA